MFAHQDQENIPNSILRFQKDHPNAKAPKKGSEKAAGYDLHAAEPTVVPARGKALVDTGIRVRQGRLQGSHFPAIFDDPNRNLRTPNCRHFIFREVVSLQFLYKPVYNKTIANALERNIYILANYLCYYIV